MAFKISVRSLCSGKPTYKMVSRRPGRRMAGSMISGLLVAANMYTPLRSSTPSISVSSWLTIRVPELLPSPPSDRLGHKESNSSKKMTQGAEFRARWKQARTARSLSPTYYTIYGHDEQCKKYTTFQLSYHVHKFGALHRYEIDASLIGNSLGQKSFAATRRTA